MNQKGICPICHNYDELIPILNANAPTKLRCPECLTHDEREAARHAKEA